MAEFEFGYWRTLRLSSHKGGMGTPRPNAGDKRGNAFDVTIIAIDRTTEYPMDCGTAT